MRSIKGIQNLARLLLRAFSTTIPAFTLFRILGTGKTNPEPIAVCGRLRSLDRVRQRRAVARAEKLRGRMKMRQCWVSWKSSNLPGQWPRTCGPGALGQRVFGGMVWLAVLLLASSASAQLRLPKFFSNGMVVQRDAQIQVWGWDTPGTLVQVALDQQTAAAKADDNGQWQVALPAMAAGGPWMMSVRGTQAIQFTDVWVGDLWLCSGQSNMEWPVAASANQEAEIAAGNHPKIRHLKVQHRPSAAPEEDLLTEGWKVASPETVGSFSAVGYFFARHLRTEVDVPIGLIGSNWGGTRIEPWTPPAGFQAVKALNWFAENLASFPEKRPDGQINHQSPLALYNGMIHPLIKLPIRGAIWYQGESNNGEGLLYRDKMEGLITGWRKAWNQPELPFYFVQLAPYNYGGDGQRLAKIWEAQTAALGIDHTGMAVTVDIGNLADIHPTNKQDVGKRLALWALAKTYGKDVAYSGPLYSKSQVHGNGLLIEFAHATKLNTRDGQPVNELMIAGSDRRFFPATGEIVEAEGQAKLLVSSPEVSRPVAVRYGFHQLAQPNLVNSAGLPASPFRTDAWEQVFLPVPPAAYVGRWTVRFQIPDGNAISHPLHIEQADGSLKIEMTDENGRPRTLTVTVRPHELQLQFNVDYQGQIVGLVYYLSPDGDKLSGFAEFEAGGETGEFAIEATK
jgi:sialate O-acetylesterase